tara:strand:- start:14 stop:985 length:972 start_codon:yes stop_codon:yes gene_type:complete
LLVFIKNNIEKSRNLISLFYGPKYKRKDISNRFHNWRKSIERSDSEKNTIIIEGTRSQYTEQFKNWKWIIIQTVLWLAISIKYDFHYVINLMAFFTILNQFIENIFSIAQEKRQIFNTFMTQEILAMYSLSNLLWEEISFVKNDDDIIVTKKLPKSIEFEWTDIIIELLPNEYNNKLPFLRIHIGNEKSEILNPSSLGLVKSSNHKEQNELFILLKIFGQYGYFTFDGHNTQKRIIDELVRKLSKNLIFYFGEKDLDPIQYDNETGRWECFINVDDKTNCWHEIEQKRNQDIFLLLESWIPLKEEIEKIDKREESYRMKGYEW